jgi:hypothetical protein
MVHRRRGTTPENSPDCFLEQFSPGSAGELSTGLFQCRVLNKNDLSYFFLKIGLDLLLRCKVYLVSERTEYDADREIGKEGRSQHTSH